MYAVIGIPLFFSYLSKTGDMMASLFRLAYARGCKPIFRMLKRRRGRSSTKIGIYNSVQSLALIANFDASVSRLNRRGSTASNDSGNLRGNPSLHSYKTTRSEESPQTSRVLKRSKSTRARGQSRGKNPRNLKRSVSSRSLRELRRNAVAAAGDGKTSESSHHLTPGNKLAIPQSTSLDSTNRHVKKMLAQVGNDNVSMKSAIINGPSVNGVKRKLIIQNVPKPQTEERKINVPISLTLCMMFIYILIGATVFSMWEKQDYIRWSYFCFVTLSTIGFGDIVPGKPRKAPLCSIPLFLKIDEWAK
ncbi:unnamed protein product [Rodentolepis nana]|uniref:Ion_trans_2 domain-containing protein n=1 Tax=Rodentolepis nana TaxID=102285 RepID=A0A0R3TT89_RODNA|nr:unnamed protein product [Rodentolepis nana]